MKTTSAVYGISTLLTLPVQLVNIPFYEFISANPENGFASANYILGTLENFEYLYLKKNFEFLFSSTSVPICLIVILPGFVGYAALCHDPKAYWSKFYDEVEGCTK